MYTHSSRSRRALLAIAATAVASVALAGSAKALSTAAGYNVSVYATPPTGSSAPDSLAVYNNDLFVGYGDHGSTTGTEATQIVEYNLQTGQTINTFTVHGHQEGIKVDPATGLVYATQNEDGPSNLAVINPVTGAQQTYNFPNPSQHGGGFDDLAFTNGQLFASGSQANPNTNGIASHVPVLYRLSLNAAATPGGLGTVTTTPILYGDATATNSVTGKTTVLNNIDPDSLTTLPNGHLLAINQSGAESVNNNNLVEIANPGLANQSVTTLSTFEKTGSTVTPIDTDDTQLVSSTTGYFLFADKGGNVYKLSASSFQLGYGISSDATNNTLDLLNYSTGLETPIVTGLVNPGGVLFIPTVGSGSPVPEPASAGLLTLGLVGLAGYGLRRRRIAAG